MRAVWPSVYLSVCLTVGHLAKENLTQWQHELQILQDCCSLQNIVQRATEKMLFIGGFEQSTKGNEERDSLDRVHVKGSFSAKWRVSAF